jgi:hypothetical protein
MTPELAAFSDWTLALLPRLFLYPGGLWLLAILLLLRFTSGGIKSTTLRSLLASLANGNLLSIALTWAAVALIPLPGASPLPLPVDRLVLAVLPLLSLLIDITNEESWSVAAAGAITLGLMLPTLAGGALLAQSGTLTLLGALSILLVLIGLLALSSIPGMGIATQTRWLAWLCLGLTPLWGLNLQAGIWWVSLTTAIAVVLLAALPALLARAGGLRNRSSRIYPPGAAPGTTPRTTPTILVAIAWLLALAALVWALPAP